MSSNRSTYSRDLIKSLTFPFSIHLPTITNCLSSITTPNRGNTLGWLRDFHLITSLQRCVPHAHHCMLGIAGNFEVAFAKSYGVLKVSRIDAPSACDWVTYLYKNSGAMSLQSLRCLPRRIVGFHSINKPRLARAPTKKRTGKVGSYPDGAGSPLLESYANPVSREVGLVS